MTQTQAPHPYSHTEDHKHPLIAILLACVAYGYFNINDAAMKFLAMKFHFSQIMIFNCIVMAVFMCVYGMLTDGRRVFAMKNPRLVMLRAVLSLSVGVLNILALPHVKLAVFYTLVFTSPLWVAVLSFFFLKEKWDARRVVVILFGFAVVVFTFRPGSGLFNVWTVLVLLSAFLYAASMIVMRRLGPEESRTMIVCSSCLLSTLACLPFLPGHYLAPTPYELGLFLMIGVLGAVGVMCVAYAYQNAPSASAVAPYHYTQIVWGTALGYFIFNEVPQQRTMIGAALIIAAGLYLIYRETRRNVLPRAAG